MSEFLRRYETSMSTFTDAPTVFHTASAVCIFGALLTRHKYRCRLQGGVPARWTNIWVVLEGATGGPKKSTAVNMAADILRRVDESIEGPNDGSPEGFMRQMHRMDQSQPGNATSIFIVEEFATLLSNMQKTYAQALKHLLTNLYDGPPKYLCILAKQQYEIRNPRVSLLGGVATELLPGMTVSMDWLGGFLNRALIIHGEAGKELPRGLTPTEKVMAGHADNLFECLRYWRNAQVRRKRPLYDFDAKALKLALSLPKSHDDQVLNSMMVRSRVHLMKVAAVEQIDEDPEAPAIGVKAVERSMKLIAYWQKTLPDLVHTCFVRGREDFEGDRLPKRILRYLKSAPKKEACWPAVMKSCALSVDHMWKAVQALIDSGEVKVDERGEGTDSTDKSQTFLVHVGVST